MYFLKAKPMWISGKEKVMNHHIVLKADVIDLKNTILYITAACSYRLTVNGEFVAYGPARTAEGYARVDAISLDRFSGKPAEITLEVSGYNCCSYVCVKQDSFVVAELRKGDEVLLTTSDFKAFENTRAVRKVLRYAGQRHFTEVYDDRKYLFDAQKQETLSVVESGIKYLDRHVQYPEYNTVKATLSARGSFEFSKERAESRHRGVFNSKSNWGNFDNDEIKFDPYTFVLGSEFSTDNNVKLSELKAGEYAVFDLGKLYSGFINWELSAIAESDVVIAYSEMCFDADFEYTTLQARSAIEQLLPIGKSAKFSSFEPYTARFVAVLVKSGCVDLKGVSLTTYEKPQDGVKEYNGDDADLKRIYNAAIRSFCHNAVDLYTDCPSRERAGWLCDSFFSGKAEYELFGNHTVEDNFLENYTLFEKNERLPEGVLPMCYPADVNFNEDSGYIPQWNLWYILEVYEYLTVRNKSADKERFKKSVLGVLNFFKGFENADGLVERLPSWNFVEWSTANYWTNDVNYPTNFLYSEALLRAGKLFGMDDLIKKAEAIRKKTVELSFDGEKFCDHAVRNSDGTLENQPHVSAAAQYYAALFGGIDICSDKFALLLCHIKENFENLDIDNIEFVPVNAFIGFYLRMELLMRLGEKKLLETDIKDFFAETVKHTDTLWEHRYRSGSYDHGFSSYVTLAINFIER
ncbi:MAG: hypothetical protein IJW27_03010 [Clostridia bacterium]|nr:hypothetical protein [Clostridia bacterium]